jgi:hypothetical protein
MALSMHLTRALLVGFAVAAAAILIPGCTSEPATAVPVAVTSTAATTCVGRVG